MIRLISNGKMLYIIEPGNIDKLVSGNPMILDNGAAVIYTPDINWVAEQILSSPERVTPDKLSKIIDESLTRPPVRDRPYHPPLFVRSLSEEPPKES